MSSRSPLFEIQHCRIKEYLVKTNILNHSHECNKLSLNMHVQSKVVENAKYCKLT